MSRIAIIPARGGSKRIPRKNVADFCGRPMIEYSLRAAEASELFDTIHVSTEDEGIAAVVRKLGFDTPFLRPKHLADDVTPIMPVLRHALTRFAEEGMHFDQVCLILATCPFLEAEDLRGAARLYDQHHGEQAVLSVAPYPVPIEWAYGMEENGQLIPRTPGAFAIRSQELETCYYDTGTFVLFPTSFILEADGAGDDTRYVGYPLAKHKGIDIDDAHDWAFAEIVFRSLYLSKD